MENIKKAFTKQVMCGIAVAGFLLMLILYVFVYLKYTELTADLEVSNKKLERSVSELETYYKNMDKYEKESAQIEKYIGKILDEYPADAKEEDVLMLAVTAQEEAIVNYRNINMVEPTLVYAVPENIVTAAGLEGYEKEIDFMEKTSTYLNFVNYENLKELIEQIYASPNRIAIQNISYEVWESNPEVLEGIIDLSFYSVTGTDKEYVVPEIEEYTSGTETLFPR